MSRAPTASSMAMDDARAELAGIAARAERRNSPKFLVLLGVLALMLSAAFAYASWRSAQEQQGYARNAQRAAEDTIVAAGKLKAILAADEQRGTQDDGPVTQLLSRLEAAGTMAGLKKAVPVGSRMVGSKSAGWVQQRISYTINDESLGAIMKWVGLAVQDVPGLRVSSLSLKPLANEWSVSVQFSRWERTEGT